MLFGYHPVAQALMGTFFTWFVTAMGAATVVLLELSSDEAFKAKFLDGMLGFAAGVMLAASYWSLLAPAIEHAEQDPMYGPDGRWAFVPAAVGFALGGLGMVAVDYVMPMLGSPSPVSEFIEQHKKDDDAPGSGSQASGGAAAGGSSGNLRFRGKIADETGEEGSVGGQESPELVQKAAKRKSWHRIVLLVIAITLHNFPEGLAVGVGFGAIDPSDRMSKAAVAKFANARNLAIGIGLQNFPEGLAVSMPLRRQGMSLWKSLWYGQLSGLVEPVGGILGAYLVQLCNPVLPYALAFAAGAMVYVVVDDLVPEAHEGGNSRLSTCGCMVGFLTMMSLDVGLG